MSGGCRIASIAYALGSRPTATRDLCPESKGWNPEELIENTGIQSRPIAGPNETALDLGVAAAEKLFKEQAVQPDEIDTLIFCTVTPDYPAPGNGYLAHGRLNLATDCQVFDLSHGCSGFLNGLQLAQLQFETPGKQNVLLINGDTLSHYCHPEDRGTFPIFGDGAAATLLTPRTPDARLGPVEMRSLGREWERVLIRSGGRRLTGSSHSRLDPLENIRSDAHISLDGGAILAMIRRHVPELMAFSLDRAETKWEDVDHFFFHQASLRTLNWLRKRLEIPLEKTWDHLQNRGNLSAASLPILLRDAQDEGRLHQGDRCLVTAFGSGFSMGCAVIKW